MLNEGGWVGSSNSAVGRSPPLGYRHLDDADDAAPARSRNLNDLQMRELVMVFIRPRRAPPLLGCRSSL